MGATPQSKLEKHTGLLILLPVEHDLRSLRIAQIQAVGQGKCQLSPGVGFPEIDGLTGRFEFRTGRLA